MTGDTQVSYGRFVSPHRRPKPITRRSIPQVSFGLDSRGGSQAITLSKDPPLVGVCYAPLQHTVPLQTGRGVHLGSTPAEVVRLYGKPSDMFSFGLIARFRYEVMLDHPVEWDLVFRDGHLVEWTVAIED